MRNMRKLAAETAQKISALSAKNALTLPKLFEMLMELQTNAYAQGLHTAGEPMQAMSRDIDRRMATLGLDGMGDSGDARA